MRKPDIFLVGAARCGTTSMYRYLRQHPQIFGPEKKEPCHFATDLDSGSYQDGRYFVRDRDAYLGLFEPARADQLPLDGSVWHLYSEVAAGAIHDFNPEVRILAMVRNPVDMMESWHARRLLVGAEDIPDFGEALEAEPDRRAGRRIPPASFNVKTLQYRAIARFSEQLERYLGAFPRERIRVIVFDDFVRDPLAVYRQTLEFLGVDAGFTPVLEVGNPSRTVRFRPIRDIVRDPRLHRIANRVIPQAAWARVRPAFRRLHAVNARDEKRPPMDPALRRKLEAEFVPEVERLGALLDRDLLGLWRYPVGA